MLEGDGVTRPTGLVLHVKTPLDTELLVDQQRADVDVIPFDFTAPFSVAEVPVMSDAERVIAVGLPATKLRIDPFVVPFELEPKILK